MVFCKIFTHAIPTSHQDNEHFQPQWEASSGPFSVTPPNLPVLEVTAILTFITEHGLCLFSTFLYGIVPCCGHENTALRSPAVGIDFQPVLLGSESIALSV